MIDSHNLMWEPDRLLRMPHSQVGQDRIPSMASFSARPSRLPAEKTQPTRVHAVLVLSELPVAPDFDDDIEIDTRTRSIILATDEQNSVQEHGWDIAQAKAMTSPETSWEHPKIAEYAGVGQKFMVLFPLLPRMDDRDHVQELLRRLDDPDYRPEGAQGPSMRLVTGSEDGVVR
jgi:hypothetical protein